MLQSHYSSTLDFSTDALNAAEKGFKKLANALTAIKKIEHTGAKEIDEEIVQELNRLIDECYLTMSDDFNTAKTLLAVLFEMSGRINDMKSGNLLSGKIPAEVFGRFRDTYIGFMDRVLGLQEEKEHNDDLLKGTIQILIELRKKARLDKNFALSDKIRDDLKGLGVNLMDGKNGEMNYSIE
jgi:cysteinyl-tRNA synthetase